MKTCEHCGSFNLTRDEVDIGVGIQYGPWICQDCGWSEDAGLDIRSFDNEPEEPIYHEDFEVDQDAPLNKFGGG